MGKDPNLGITELLTFVLVDYVSFRLSPFAYALLVICIPM